VLATLVALTLLGEPAPPPPHSTASVTLDALGAPLPWLAWWLDVAVERRLGDHLALAVQGGRGWYGWMEVDERYGFGGAQLRWYRDGAGAQRYLAASAVYLAERGADYRGRTLQLGALAGIRWVGRRGFTLDLQAGAVSQLTLSGEARPCLGPGWICAHGRVGVGWSF
jgi:hypothetical protein